MSKNDASNNKHLIGAELGQRFFAATVHHLSLVGQQLIRYDCLTSAAALTYTTLFAVVPLMTVTLLFFLCYLNLRFWVRISKISFSRIFCPLVQHLCRKNCWSLLIEQRG